MINKWLIWISPI